MKLKKIIKKTKNTFRINEQLVLAANSSIEKLFDEHKTSCRGISNEVAEVKRREFGKNEIRSQKKISILNVLFDSFVNPFSMVLFFIALMSTFTDVLTCKGTKGYTSSTIVLSMIFTGGIIRFVQEMRFGKAIKKLYEMIKTTILVSRIDVGKTEISISQIVPGDIIHLNAGDMVPADVRIIKSKDLFISQSSLTGESEPVEKKSTNKSENILSPMECDNLAFMGSSVISGTATCIVLVTGSKTLFGSIMQSLNKKKISKNFEKSMNSVSWVLINFMIIMAIIVFLINGITKKRWFEAFLFAASIAVGLTPEMLPMIITTNLAKGAVNMFKKKTIIKNLNSIQDFGAMDVLCTDKTGTLTQDKVILEYHMNVHGEEEERILKHAFLNSFFQTGLKNLMDIAILEYASEKDMKNISSDYKKIDEIPFDFTRRRMSVVVTDKSGKKQIITKGAVEEMIKISSFVEYKGKVTEISNDLIKEIFETVEKLNSDGMRVIALSQKTNPSSEGEFSVSDESNMVLMGYLAFLDPPKETTSLAIKALKNHGINIKILTGDNDSVTKCICKKVGLEVSEVCLGSQLDDMSELELSDVVEKTNVFAKLSPIQKDRIVKVLKKNGHVVGFLGDGINDSVALKNSDVGISVDTAVDIAKESADIILLEKNLMVLEEGVIEGRKIFGNMIKYIKITVSSNFGNMLSVLIASIFLPFLPMFPIQILVLNLINDISCISIPWDSMDKEYTKVPRNFDANSIKNFMFWFGPCSSIADIAMFAVMFFAVIPKICRGSYFDDLIIKTNFESLFSTGWFLESLFTQVLVTHVLRTKKKSWIKNHASFIVVFITFLSMLIGIIIPYSSFGKAISMKPLPLNFFGWMSVILMFYANIVTIFKNKYIKKYNELL